MLSLNPCHPCGPCMDKDGNVVVGCRPILSLCSLTLASHSVHPPPCRDKDGNVLETTNAAIALALKHRTKDDVTGARMCRVQNV